METEIMMEWWGLMTTNAHNRAIRAAAITIHPAAARRPPPVEDGGLNTPHPITLHMTLLPGTCVFGIMK